MGLNIYNIFDNTNNQKYQNYYFSISIYAGCFLVYLFMEVFFRCCYTITFISLGHIAFISTCPLLLFLLPFIQHCFLLFDLSVSYCLYFQLSYIFAFSSSILHYCLYFHSFHSIAFISVDPMLLPFFHWSNIIVFISIGLTLLPLFKWAFIIIFISIYSTPFLLFSFTPHYCFISIDLTLLRLFQLVIHYCVYFSRPHIIAFISLHSNPT